MVRALEGVITEHDAIKREVGLLRQLVEETTSNDVRNREEEEFGAGDDDARSVRTMVLDELEGVEDEDRVENSSCCWRTSGGRGERNLVDSGPLSLWAIYRASPIRVACRLGKKPVEGQWRSVREKWATERERLASAMEEWESKVKAVETNLGTTAAKFDAGLANLKVLQQHQQQRQQASQPLGLGNGEVVKGLHGSGRGGRSRPQSAKFEC